MLSRTAIAFGFVGPLVGLVSFALLGGLFNAFIEHSYRTMSFRTSPEFWRLRLALTGLLSPSGLVLAYIFGTVPALIAGILAGVLVRRTRSRVIFLLVCTIGGAIISGIASKAMMGDMAVVTLSASAGAVAAIILSGALWKLAQPCVLPVIEQELS